MSTEKISADDWVTRLEKRDLRALSRLMSAAENRERHVLEVLARLHGKLGRARVIGITGPPGAGKSTLTGAFREVFGRGEARSR